MIIDSITVDIKDRVGILSPGEEHMVALIPPVPIDHTAPRAGHAPALVAQ